MIPQTATPSRFLTTAETLHLFTLIWHHDLDEAHARETLIQSNIASVRNYIAKHPAFSWYDSEDIEQEAYRVLLEALAIVPPFAHHPGAYLYKVACTLVLKAAISICPVTSLDTPLPSREGSSTRYEIIAPPTTPDQRPPTSVTTPLHAAIHRLPLSQQQALSHFFQLDDFSPHANSRRVHPLPDRSKRRTDLRSVAYHALRRDPELQAVLPARTHTQESFPCSPLKHYRILHGWTQRWVADTLGVHKTVVGRWESGNRKPGTAHREKLCHLYGVNAEQLGLKGA